MAPGDPDEDSNPHRSGDVARPRGRFGSRRPRRHRGRLPVRAHPECQGCGSGGSGGLPGTSPGSGSGASPGSGSGSRPASGATGGDPATRARSTTPAGSDIADSGDTSPATGGPRYTIEQFLGTVNFVGNSFSPDASKILVGSNRTGIFNVYAVPVAGGEPVALTRSTTDNVIAVGYFPADERFLYLSNRGGNELDHLYVQSPGNAVVDLTPGDKLKASFLDWARDDRSFFVHTNERDPRFFDVYEYQADGYARKMIYKDEAGLSYAAISPDRGTLALVKSGGSTADSDIYLYDAKSGKARNITPHEGDVANAPYTFSPDGRSLYYATNQGSEFSYLVRYDLATAKVEEVLRTPLGRELRLLLARRTLLRRRHQQRRADRGAPL